MDGRRTVAAKALTMKQLGKALYAAIGFTAHFHVQVENWRDTDEIVPKEKVSWYFVQKRREGRKHRTEQCNDLGGHFDCMRCGKRCKQAQKSWRVPWLSVNGQRGHDLQRVVGKMLV